MAWQLIYTSAPRLLDAGRTGFGTVARHRAVSGLLASSVERFSQFARLPGHDTKRVVYTHRILMIGSNEFHVLSCLRDAGSDYTGRTNHLAHHLIAEAREVRNLGLAGVTPADVLLGMAWLESWSTGPRFLEASDEVDLSSFRHPDTREWERLAGSLDYALMPWATEAKKGVYLVTPAGLDARTLMLESLQERPGESWSIPFTTCLEPNDDIADFKWIAVPANSPLCPQPGTASRLILDLTQPDRLPAPPSRRDTSVQPLEPAAVQAFPAPLESSALPKPQNLPAAYANVQPGFTLPANGWSPTASDVSKGRKGRGLWWLIGSVAAIGMIGGAWLILGIFNRQAEQKWVAELNEQVNATWKEYQLKLPETQRDFKAQAGSDPNFSRNLEQLREQLGKIRAALEAGEPQGQVTAISKTLPSDFEKLLKDYEAWKTSYEKASKKREWLAQSPADLTPTLAPLFADERSWSKKVASHFTDNPLGGIAGTRQWQTALYKTIVQGLFEADPMPPGTAVEWTALLATVQPEIAKPDWFESWEEAEKSVTSGQVMELTKQQEKLSTNRNVPAWVTQLIKSKIASVEARSPKTAQAEVKPNETGMSLGSTKPLAFQDEIQDDWPIYFGHQIDGATITSALAQIPPIPLNPNTSAFLSLVETQVSQSSSSAPHILEAYRHVEQKPDGKLIWRKSRMDSSPIEYTNSKFVKIPDSFVGGKIVFSSIEDGKPLLAVHVATPKTKEHNLQLLNFREIPKYNGMQSGSVVRIPNLPRLLTRIRNLTDSVSMRSITTQLATPTLDYKSDDAAATIHFKPPSVDTAAITAKKKNIEMTETAINNDKQAIEGLKTGNLADKKDRIATRQADLSKKEQYLIELKDQLKDLESPKIPEILLSSGDYYIETSKGARVCLIHIQSSSSTPIPQVTP